MGTILDFFNERRRNGDYSTGNFVSDFHAFGKNYFCINRLFEGERLCLCGDFSYCFSDNDGEFFYGLRALRINNEKFAEKCFGTRKRSRLD